MHGPLNVKIVLKTLWALFMFGKKSAKHDTITICLFCWLSVFNELGKNNNEVGATD
jgi:hypothetical protein